MMLHEGNFTSGGPGITEPRTSRFVRTIPNENGDHSLILVSLATDDDPESIIVADTLVRVDDAENGSPLYRCPRSDVWGDANIRGERGIPHGWGI